MIAARAEVGYPLPPSNLFTQQIIWRMSHAIGYFSSMTRARQLASFRLGNRCSQARKIREAAALLTFWKRLTDSGAKRHPCVENVEMRHWFI